MRILTVTSLFPRRTAPTLGVFIQQRVRALADRGVEVRVLSPLPWVPPGPVPARYRAIRATPREDTIAGLAVRYPRYFMLPKLGMRWQARGYAAGLRPALRDEAERFRPSLLDVHYLYPDACGVARVARGLGLPYACTARGSDVKVLARYPHVHAQIRDALHGAAAVLAVSQDLAREMRDLDLCDRPIEVVPNGVDRTRFFPRPRAEARRELKLPEEGRFVVCVGHLVPVHGQELLIRALACAEAPPDLSVRFVGEGPDREALQELARSLGVADRVSFEGTVPHDRVPFWFSASDASAQLSRSAGSPNAVLESIACGTPVLASDIPPMREAILDPADGLLVASQPDEVARGLRRLVERGQDAAGNAAGQASVRGWDEVATEVLACFERALGGGRA